MSPRHHAGQTAGDSHSGAAVRPRGFVFAAMGGVALIGAAAFALASAAVGQHREALETSLRAEVLDLADARAAVLATWLEGVRRIGRRITRSELVQVYAETREATDPPAAWLLDQEPYIGQLLNELVVQHDLMGAALVNAAGEVLLGGGDAAGSLSPASAGRHPVGPIREVVAPGIGSGLAFDLFLPVSDTRAAGAAASEVSLVMTVRAGQALDALARRNPSAADLPAGQLIQGTSGNGPTWIDDGAIADLPGSLAAVLSPGAQIEPVAQGSGASLLAVMPVPGTPWAVLQRPDHAVVSGAIATFERRAQVAAGGATLLLGGAFAFFLHTRVRRRRLVAAQADDQAEVADRFQRIVETIAAGVSDGIGFKDPEGRYVFVNPPLGRALGHDPDDVIGRTDADLVGSALARAHAPGGQPARWVTDLVNVPLPDCGRRAGGALVLAPGRELGPAARAGDEVDHHGATTGPAGSFLEGAIAVLVHAVELRDPFLAGHAGRLSGLALAVGHELGLDEDRLRALELAARLSQVGKIFIPDAVLAKPGRHSPDEAAEMRSHIARALELLEPARLDPAVVEALGGMHERLDGSGYPHGLRDEEVAVVARVLGVCDVFCARTAPRAYREQVSPGQALYHLAGHPERYDAQVVSALIAVIARDQSQQHLALPAPDVSLSAVQAA